MERKEFIKSAAIASAGLATKLEFLHLFEKTHVITLSFDDGFRNSFYKVAEIYEEYGLSACFNVIASGHLPTFKKVDDWILPELMGDFDDWNMLKSQGHEVMPHSWQHLNLAKQPIALAKDNIEKCLEYFGAHLEGYKNEEAVFNFPFNSSTPELEEFTLSKVLAIRSRELDEVPPGLTNVFRKGCRSMGPKNIDVWVEKEVNSFLDSSGGWLILNVHGLENEGWGPMSTSFLDSLLKKIVSIKTLEVLPTGSVLNRLI